MVRISVLTPDDLDFALSLTESEGWGYGPTDFGRILSLETEGCFIARDIDVKVGMVTTCSYEDYAFIGNLIVKADNRGRGIGKGLMRHAISYLEDKGIPCIELDATFQGAPLYRKLGFRDKYLSLRLGRIVDEKPSQVPYIETGASEKLVGLDAELTGLKRSRVLDRFISDFPDAVYTADNNNMKGYALVYPRGHNIWSIGPLVSDSQETAELLLNKIIKHNGGRRLSIGLPDLKQDFVSFLLENGFHYRPPSLRMFLGPRRDYESAVYAILSPDKG